MKEWPRWPRQREQRICAGGGQWGWRRRGPGACPPAGGDGLASSLPPALPLHLFAALLFAAPTGARLLRPPPRPWQRPQPPHAACRLLAPRPTSVRG